jgi:hypothetical protein
MKLFENGAAINCSSDAFLERTLLIRNKANHLCSGHHVGLTAGESKQMAQSIGELSQPAQLM